jgi:hypothetical protein
MQCGAALQLQRLTLCSLHLTGLGYALHLA